MPTARYLAVALVGAALMFSMAPDAAVPEIPYETFTLDNGLTVVVHEDEKAPIVAVNVWYHVGSKNEPEGRTGFAHLFEHLMFQGSENYDDEYFKPFERVGATSMNGTTSFDRTNYFANVPTTALDLALWMESDRMGHLLGAIDQERLDEQREVVKNEKRQGENQPYGRVFEHIFGNVFPEGHPYHWTPIGSMADLDAASLEDVKDWFRTYYGPNNAVISIAGDVDAETVRDQVAHHFGQIPPGPTLTTMARWIPELDGERREIMEDRVPQARIYKTWVAPERDTRSAAHLALVNEILAGGKTSRLYERLVYDEQAATDIGASPFFGEIAGAMILWATAQPGDTTEDVEAMLDEALARFLAEGPTESEVRRAKTALRSDFVRGMERVGGFGGKSDLLAEGMVYAGDPGQYRREMEWLEAATAEDLRDTARRWLGDDAYVLDVRPFPDDLHASPQADVDRSSPPYPDAFPEPDFPEFERATLSNGMDVIVAQRDAVPVVEMELVLDAGYAADQFAAPGVANMAMAMLDEGTEQRTALEISEEAAQLGAEIGAGSNLDSSFVTLSALEENLDESLALYADVILEPAFPEPELARLKKQTLAAIANEKVEPFPMGLRVLPQLLYGDDHAYSVPFSGTGTEASVNAMTPADLQGFHDTWFKADNATLVVVGDTSLAEIRPRLERHFSDWQPGEVPQKNLGPVTPPDEPVVYLVDRPESQQSMIIAGQAAPPKANPDEVAIEAMNDVLGGTFTSRVNMNLREDKGWSYGARSTVVDAEGPRPLMVYAPVQADKTAESMTEMLREVEELVGSSPVTEQEVEKVKRTNTLSLPGRWETASAVADSISQLVRFGLPDDHWDTYPHAVQALDPRTVQQAAEQVLTPGQLTWVVVGDRDRIEPALRELGVGEIRHIDADGNLL
ncbi:MAG: M16 family metallopeptidase [Pseudomonadota bacterium]